MHLNTLLLTLHERVCQITSKIVICIIILYCGKPSLTNSCSCSPLARRIHPHTGRRPHLPQPHRTAQRTGRLTFRMQILDVGLLHVQGVVSNPRPVPQLQREVRPFPKLKILRKVETIDDFRAEDFEICGYQPHPAIKMQMAV